LVEGGPVYIAFLIYEDFFVYGEGIYQYTTGDFMGGHAVKVVGFGEEDGVEYWIGQNQWGPRWGDNGYFKIAFNTVEAGYSSGSCDPDFDGIIYDEGQYLNYASAVHIFASPIMFLSSFLLLTIM
jgi:C1A family cysteine protease